MHSNETIAEVRKLLELGVSYRGIAKRLGVSRAFVWRVHNGKTKPRKHPAPKEHVQKNTVGKCPICNARVVLPCLACSLRKIKMVAYPKDERLTPLELELTPEQDKRRKEIRNGLKVKRNVAS